MAKKWKQPKLVMGHLEVISGPDMEVGIPYDQAVIHIEGDEDSEIEISCPGALRLAPIIVRAVNNHDALVEALEEQREWLAGKSASAMLNGSPHDDGAQDRIESINRVLGDVGGSPK